MASSFEDPESQLEELLFDLDSSLFLSHFDIPRASEQDFFSNVPQTNSPSLLSEAFHIPTPQSSPQHSPTSSENSPQVKIEIVQDDDNHISDNQFSDPPHNPKKRSRKRQRKSDLEPICQTVLTLPRSDLLKLSCADFEAKVEQITKDRKLTFEEEQECRRQKRLIKNRESAHASRVRKKSYVEQLEQKISDLESEVQRLRSDKEYFQQEVLRLQNSLKSMSPEITFAPVPVPVMGGSVCLMIVLFVFGLYMMPGMLPALTTPPPPTPPTEFHYHPTQVSKNHHTGRTLLSAENKTLGLDPDPVDICTSDLHENSGTQLVEIFEPKSTKVEKQIETRRNVPSSTPVVDEKPKVVDLDVTQSLYEHRTPNVTYLLCSDIKQIIPESTEIQERVTEEDPMLVTLVFPLDALRGSSLGGSSSISDDSTAAFIEVTCQILEINEVSVPQFTSLLISSTHSQSNEEPVVPISVI